MFFDRIGTQALPLMYLAQAGATLVAMFALTAVLERVRHRSIYIWSPLLLASIVMIERGVLFSDVRWIYPLLWVTVAFATLAQAIGLWGTAGAVVDARQAKRLFPIFGAGGILGAVLGGLLTRPLASVLGVENLLLVWVGGLLVASMLCRLSLGPRGAVRAVAARRHGSVLQDLKGGFDYVRRSRLLLGMAAAAVLFSVLFYSLFLPFATVSTERYTDADALAGFFGLIGASITGCAFLISILLTNRLFARFGVTAMVLVLPMLYLGSFAILLVATGFVTVVILRVMTGVWLQGVASPAWETLVNVVPDDRRDQTRAFLNGGPAQVGTAIAGVVALVGQDVLTGRQFAMIGIVAALLTLAAVLVIHRSYGDALLEALLAVRPQVFEKATAWTAIPLDVDAEATGVLADAMRSDDIRKRRTAFQLASSLPTDALTAQIVEGLDDADPIVRLAAVRSLDLSTAEGREALLAMTDDVDPSVAAAASSRAAGLSDAHALAQLERLLGDDDARVRTVALEQLGSAPRAVAADLVARVLDDPDANVRVAALDRLAQAAPDRALPSALARMRDPDPSGSPGGRARPRRHRGQWRRACARRSGGSRTVGGGHRGGAPPRAGGRNAAWWRTSCERRRPGCAPTTPSSPPFPWRPRRRPFSGTPSWIAADAWRGPHSGPPACWSRNGSRCRRRSTGSTDPRRCVQARSKRSRPRAPRSSSRRCSRSGNRSPCARSTATNGCPRRSTTKTAPSGVARSSSAPEAKETR